MGTAVEAELLKRLPDPNSVGEGEYRLLYEWVKTILADADEDENPIDLLEASLGQVREWLDRLDHEVMMVRYPI